MSYEMTKYLINVVNEFDFMRNSSVFCFVKMKAHSLISEYIQIILPVKPAANLLSNLCLITFHEENILVFMYTWL